MNEQLTIQTERVDDVPLLIGHMERMGLAALLDTSFPPHGNRTGMSLGWVSVVWLAHLLSHGDHRLNQVRPWAAGLATTLQALLPCPVRPTDLTDDRLALVLRSLSDDAHWAAFEAACTQQTLRVYDLHPTTVRLDSTTASGYWQVSDDGVFQFGHSKDHRPDLPQVKVMLASLDPLGMPVAVDVVAGQHTDDPLYLPIIARVRTSLGRRGLLYVGDCKLGALGTRAVLAQHGDHYVCPLGSLQLPPAALNALIETALSTPLELRPITRMQADGTLEYLALGTEVAVELTSQTTTQASVTWTERRILVQSLRAQAAAIQGLHARLTAAEQALATLVVARRGKERPTTPAALDAAIQQILATHKVAGLLSITPQATAHTRVIRPYRGQPARTLTTYTLALTSHRDLPAIASAEARLGWRVYATNRPATELSLTQTVLAYREEYLIERSFARLKGSTLSLSPVYLSRDDHTIGLIRLLTIGLRVLTALEYGIRQQLQAEGTTLAGLYAGQPNRTTNRPTAERILEVFRNLTLTIVDLPEQIIHHLTPLSPIQQRLFALAGLDPGWYDRLTGHSFKPLGEIREQ